MGGGFGGKETQGNLFACVAALVGARRPAARPRSGSDRDDDMVITGKRHDFVVDYDVGFDDEGRIQGVDMTVRRALRLLGRPVRAGQRPGDVPRRQRYYYADVANALAAAARPTPSPTPPFAASAGRRAWWRSSG